MATFTTGAVLNNTGITFTSLRLPMYLRPPQHTQQTQQTQQTDNNQQQNQQQGGYGGY